MPGLEVLVEPCARGGEKQAHHVERAAYALLAPGIPREACKRPDRHRRTKQPEEVLGFGRKGGDEPAPRLGICIREGRHSRDGFFEIGADTEPAAIGKSAGEAVCDGRKFQPVRFQFICILPVECRAGEEAQVHRAEIMTEARERKFTCLDGAADGRISLENCGFPALRRQMRGACQTVMASPDKYGVELTHAPSHRSFMLKDNCRCICFRLVGY